MSHTAILKWGNLADGDQAMRSMQQIEALLEGLSRDELLALIEHIARRLRQREERTPQPLYGIWKGKFPEDADIDAALKEIRQQWQEDFEEFQK
jgi:uncharacterized protein YceH (UPF0502 family)